MRTSTVLTFLHDKCHLEFNTCNMQLNRAVTVTDNKYVLKNMLRHYIRGINPYGTGWTCPPIFMKVISPNILSLFYPVTATTVVCCILMQICAVSQKVPQTPYRGFVPGPCWGTSVPRLPVFFYVPPIILLLRHSLFSQQYQKYYAFKLSQ